MRLWLEQEVRDRTKAGEGIIFIHLSEQAATVEDI